MSLRGVNAKKETGAGTELNVLRRSETDGSDGSGSSSVFDRPGEASGTATEPEKKGSFDKHVTDGLIMRALDAFGGRRRSLASNGLQNQGHCGR